MSSRPTSKHQRSLAMRLTLLHSLVLMISTMVVAGTFYLLLTHALRSAVDEAILEAINEISTILETRGIEAVPIEMAQEALAGGTNKTFYRLVRSDGSLIGSSNLADWEAVDVDVASVSRALTGSTIFETHELPDSRGAVRILYVRIAPEVVLQAGHSLAESHNILMRFRRVSTIALLATVVFAAVVGWILVRGALWGIRSITATTTAIVEGDFDRRVPVTGANDEIDQLAFSINVMLDRITALMSEMRQVTENIAHELRSPISRLRGEAEVMLSDMRTLAEYREFAANTVEECDGLTSMINTMLDIAETEVGLSKERYDMVTTSDLVRDICDLFIPAAQTKGLLLRFEVDESCLVWGDEGRLRRVLANLLDNALKYTPADGEIRVSSRTVKGRVVIKVTDTGPGIPEADLPHVFERFYRADRSRSQPGTGLGLSLVRAVVKSHGGDITIFSRSGKGTTVCIKLPAMAPH